MRQNQSTGPISVLSTKTKIAYVRAGSDLVSGFIADLPPVGQEDVEITFRGPYDIGQTFMPISNYAESFPDWDGQTSQIIWPCEGWIPNRYASLVWRIGPHFALSSSEQSQNYCDSGKSSSVVITGNQTIVCATRDTNLVCMQSKTENNGWTEYPFLPNAPTKQGPSSILFGVHNPTINFKYLVRNDYDSSGGFFKKIQVAQINTSDSGNKVWDVYNITSSEAIPAPRPLIPVRGTNKYIHLFWFSWPESHLCAASIKLREDGSIDSTSSSISLQEFVKIPIPLEEGARNLKVTDLEDDRILVSWVQMKHEYRSIFNSDEAFWQHCGAIATLGSDGKLPGAERWQSVKINLPDLKRGGYFQYSAVMVSENFE